MNLSCKLAIGAALSLASMATFAQVAVPTPPYNTINTGGNGSATLTLFSTNDGTPFSYSFNLGLNYNDLLASNGMNTPGTTLTWSLSGLSADLTSAAGVAASANGLVFDVSASHALGSLTTAGAYGLETTVDPSVTQAIVAATTNGAISNTAAQNTTWLNAIVGAGGNPVFTTNTTDPTYANANYGAGYNQLLFNAAGSTSSALPFYAMLSSRGSTSTAISSALAYAGTWSINLTADTLTYTVAGGQTVPLPASAWLFISGLLGVVVLGRRRAGSLNSSGVMAA